MQTGEPRKSSQRRGCLEVDLVEGELSGRPESSRWPPFDPESPLPQPVTATCMPGGAVSTWSFTSCSGRKSGPALTVATTQPAVTATYCKEGYYCDLGKPITHRKACKGRVRPLCPSVSCIYLSISVCLPELPLPLLFYPHTLRSSHACTPFGGVSWKQRGSGDATQGEERGW